jgi:hypothetical protein
LIKEPDLTNIKIENRYNKLRNLGMKELPKVDD